MDQHTTCAVDLCSLSADNIHSDRCRVPLNPVLCLTAATSSRSLWTATHTRWWQRWAWFEVSCLWRCSCIKETAAEISQAASPCLLASITHTVASSARRERTQQRHLQDGLGHTTPVMCALLWCRLCWANDKARRCDVLLSGFYPAPAVFFFVSYGERLTCKQEMMFRVLVWCRKSFFSDAASVPRSRMVPACSAVTPGSFPRPLSFDSCNCYHLWWISRPHGDVTATRVFTCWVYVQPFKILGANAVTTRRAAKSRWWKTSSDTNRRRSWDKAGYMKITGINVKCSLLTPLTICFFVVVFFFFLHLSVNETEQTQDRNRQTDKERQKDKDLNTQDYTQYTWGWIYQD